MPIRFTRAACCSALVLAFHSAYAAAPDDEAAIIVTASRFPSSTDRLAAGVTVITAADIARSTATSVPEVLAKLGGVHVRNTSGDPNWQIDLRGFGMTGDQNTLILLNGQRINENELASAHLTAIPLDAIERIEILRGAGAVLYGGGATAGTINIVTRAPGGSDKTATLGLSYGSYGTSDLRAGLDLSNESFGLMLNANRYSSDNYRENNRVTDENIEGTLRHGDANASLALNFGSGHQSLGLPGSRTEAQLASNPRAAQTPYDHADTDTWHMGIVGSRRFGDNELQAELDVRNRQARADYSGYVLNTESDRLSFTPRLRLPHRLPVGDGELVAGIDLSQWNYRMNDNSGGLTRASQDSDALYLREQITLRPGTQITAGIRTQHSDDERTSSGVTAGRANRLSAYELGLRQPLTEPLAAYARYGKSFRLATVDDNAWTDTGRPLLPQLSHDSEIGIEAGKGANRLRAAWFDSAITNEIHLMVIPGFGTYGFGANSNLSPTRRTGFEVEGNWRPVSNVDLGANYRHARATFRSGTYDGIDVIGKEVPLVPRDLLTLNANWRIGAGRTFAATYRYVGEQRYDNDQANGFRHMPAYSLVDLKYSHKLADWSWSLAVDNLLDKKYYSYGIRNGAGTSFNAYPELGRRIMLGAEYAFR
jgi:iron complex outermembrane recepter protein